MTFASNVACFRACCHRLTCRQCLDSAHELSRIGENIKLFVLFSVIALSFFFFVQYCAWRCLADVLKRGRQHKSIDPRDVCVPCEKGQILSDRLSFEAEEWPISRGLIQAICARYRFDLIFIFMCWCMRGQPVVCKSGANLI